MLSQQLKELAAFAGCVGELSVYEGIIDSLSTGKTKNIAVLGETNSGKTELINKLAGAEVRKPTKVSLGEDPLMVTFNSNERKNGYEIVNANSPRCEKIGLSLFEIPINLAVDIEKGAPTPMLEEMDAVIYITSAIMPFSASDANTLSCIVNKFPLIVYISKADMFDNDNDYNDSVEYIKQEFKARFDDSYCEFYDAKDQEAADKMLDRFEELAVDEAREYHIMNLKQLAQSLVAEKLNGQLAAVSQKRKDRSNEQAQADDTSRQLKLEWEKVRLAMMEKEQETVDLIDKKISLAKISAKQNVCAGLNKSKMKREWMKKELKPMLKYELEGASNLIQGDIYAMTQAHEAWLISEVNRRFDKRLVLQGINNTSHIDCRTDVDIGQPDYRKMIIAAGTSVLAGGVIIASIPLLPTCIIAIPASLVTIGLVAGGVDDYEKFNKKLSVYAQDICEKNFNDYIMQLHDMLHKYYDRIMQEIRVASISNKTVVDFSDLDSVEKQIKEKLRILSNLNQ